MQGAAVSSGELAAHLRGNPEIKQTAQVAPDVVVLAMTTAQAERLKAAFANLIVEPNSSLSPLLD